MTINTVLARKTTKQSWSQATTIELKDMKPESLAAWIDGANSILGWKKYQVRPLDQVVVNVAELEATGHYELTADDVNDLDD